MTYRPGVARGHIIIIVFVMLISDYKIEIQGSSMTYPRSYSNTSIIIKSRCWVNFQNPRAECFLKGYWLPC